MQTQTEVINHKIKALSDLIKLQKQEAKNGLDELDQGLDERNQELKKESQHLNEGLQKLLSTTITLKENVQQLKQLGQRLGFFSGSQTAASPVLGLLKLAVDPSTIPLKLISKLLHSQYGIIQYQDSLFDVNLNQERAISLIEETTENRQYILLLKSELAKTTEGTYMPANEYACCLFTEITGRSFEQTIPDDSRVVM